MTTVAIPVVMGVSSATFPGVESNFGATAGPASAAPSAAFGRGGRAVSTKRTENRIS